MLSNRSNLPLCQVSMFNTSPISTKCDITVRICKLFWLKLTETVYELFLRLIHISLTFSESDVATTLSYSDKNHFEASIPRKTNFKSSIWKTAPFSKTPCKLSSRLVCPSVSEDDPDKTKCQVHHPTPTPTPLPLTYRNPSFPCTRLHGLRWRKFVGFTSAQERDRAISTVVDNHLSVKKR